MSGVRFTGVATCRPPENGYTLPPEPRRAFPAKGGGIIGQQIKKLGFEIALVGHLKGLGVPVTDILENIESRQLLPEDRLRQLAAYAVDVTGDDLLGLRLGQMVSLSGLGLYGHALMNCATLLQSMTLMLRHMWVFQRRPRNAATLTRRGGDYILSYHHPRPVIGAPHFISDMFFSSVIRRTKELSGNQVTDMSLAVVYDDPGDGAERSGIVGVPVDFGAEVGTFRLPVRDATTPLPASYLPHAHAYYQQCDDLLLRMRRRSALAEDVRRVMVQARGPLPPAGKVADELGISERTLRRRLAEEQISFRDITDEVRNQLARTYLGESNLTVSDVSDLLGYHDPSTFRRAFRKWNGVTPGVYRRQTATESDPS